MKLRTRVMAMFTLLIVFFTVIPIQSDAGVYSGSGVVSNNIHEHEYTSNSKVSNSYLCNNMDGTFSRIENMGDGILVEKYNSSMQLINQAVKPFELTTFGGFYADANYRYLIYGQENPAQNDTLECIRIVKYSKDWVKIGSASIKACNTTIPFYGSGVDICEYGNYLYVRMGHRTYADANGAYHQASMTFSYNIANNQIADVQSNISSASYGSFENSAAQFIDTTGGVITTLDQSLNAPRGFVVTKYNNAAGTQVFRSACAYANAFPFSGTAGSTATNCCVGGYEVSSQYYLVAGATSPQDGSSPNRNIFIAAVPKNTFASNATSVAYLTGYANGEMMSVCTPYMIKISQNQFIVMWEARYGYSDMEKVYYAYIDGTGKRIGEVQSMDGCLSDCQPILFNGNVLWYTTNGANTRLYTIAVTAPAPTPGSVAVNPSNVYAGVDYSSVYDFNYYINHYSDVRILYGNNPIAAIQHFVQYGMAEGRQGCENFSVTIYRDNYADLRNAYGNDLKQYYYHFITNGSSEGRNARTLIN